VSGRRVPVPPDETRRHDPELYGQAGFDVRFGWGPNGLRALAPQVETLVVVDVLSFTTSVDVAVGRGAVVLPYRWRDGGEERYAAEQEAILAVPREAATEKRPWTLAPDTLSDIPAGTRLVLPSPNGSALSFAATEAGVGTVLAGCLRNPTAIAAAVPTSGPMGVLAAGERWGVSQGPLRPALEDLLGAGAVIDRLGPRQLSPEARAARAAFRDMVDDLPAVLTSCGSGRELAARGSPDEARVAAALDVSGAAPTLVEETFVDAGARSRR
jgi:2-phosphosulfolactate phosphatase